MTRRVRQPHPHSYSSTEDVLGANWPWLPWHCGLLLAQRYTLPYKTNDSRLYICVQCFLFF